MALATQFAFEAKPIIEWANGLKAAGVDLPIHIGIAGPAKLQTLIKFAIACGVGPSLKVLQKRAMDVSKLLLPYEPTDVVAELAALQGCENPDFNITNVHFFPLGVASRPMPPGPSTTAAPRQSRSTPKTLRIKNDPYQS